MSSLSYRYFSGVFLQKEWQLGSTGTHKVYNLSGGAFMYKGFLAARGVPSEKTMNLYSLREHAQKGKRGNQERW